MYQSRSLVLLLFWIALSAVFIFGCNQSKNGPAKTADVTMISRPAEVATPPPQLDAEDIRPIVTAAYARLPLPPAEFHSGAATTLELEPSAIQKTDNGFVITLPSGSPLPTPTIYRGRVYVSGGFSCQEFYCFDAQTGAVVWAASLDDDGPSSAVPYQDSILFSCESCTLFALDAEDGSHRWSHWLGDPLLSSPTLAGDRVFAVYPAEDRAEMPADETEESGSDETAKEPWEPTHIVACFDAGSGAVIWRKWIDTDCMSAPVAVGNQLFVTSVAGYLYVFNQEDGELVAARRMRATSAPVLAGDSMYLTRRGTETSDKDVTECIAAYDAKTDYLHFIAAHAPAPYLDALVQRSSTYSSSADGYEMPNGIGGGGFGGGFGGSGVFSVSDDLSPTDAEPQTADDAPQVAEQADAEHQALAADALGSTELKAAANIGQGNVSTIQSYQGSRLLYYSRNLFNCMGHQLMCTVATTGKTVWSLPMEGELETVGGHLATAPIVAGNYLFVGTVHGDILQIEPSRGEIVRKYPVGSPVRHSPVIHEGRIYVGTQHGTLVCIDTGDRKLTGWPVWGGDPGRSNRRP